MRRIKVARYGQVYTFGKEGGIPTVIIADRDYRLMRAGMRALKKIANTPSPECARDPFLCKALARQALDAFNKGARK